MSEPAQPATSKPADSKPTGPKPRTTSTAAQIDVNALGELAARAQKGDEAAFTALTHMVTPVLYRLALRLAGDERDAQDAVQESVVRSWQKLPTLRDEKATLAWMCRITRNVTTDIVRARARRNVTPLVTDDDTHRSVLDTLAAERGDPAELLAQKQARAFVHDALAQLPEKFRVVLQLREIDGFSYDEIAAALGLRPGTVESRIHRARKKLAQYIKTHHKRTLHTTPDKKRSTRETP